MPVTENHSFNSATYDLQIFSKMYLNFLKNCFEGFFIFRILNPTTLSYIFFLLTYNLLLLLNNEK